MERNQGNELNLHHRRVGYCPFTRKLTNRFAKEECCIPCWETYSAVLICKPHSGGILNESHSFRLLHVQFLHFVANSTVVGVCRRSVIKRLNHRIIMVKLTWLPCATEVEDMQLFIYIRGNAHPASIFIPCDRRYSLLKYLSKGRLVGRRWRAVVVSCGFPCVTGGHTNLRCSSSCSRMSACAFAVHSSTAKPPSYASK